MSLFFAEYLWIDGEKPVQHIRSKSRVLDDVSDDVTIDIFPEWSFDGSSTCQAIGTKSDCLLRPVRFVPDPLRLGGYLVLCEVFDANGQPHASNTRAQMRRVLDAGGHSHDPWVGFEQEYTLFQDGRPFGWPKEGVPAPQGPYYCGVGAKKALGRNLVEAHAQSCIEADLMFYGTNAEVMPSQWEFQIGYRGIPGEQAHALLVSDHLWIARWLLHRLGEEAGIEISLDSKPVKGDWNGAGMHTNYSTRETRSPVTGREVIDRYIQALEKGHKDHIAVYGDKLEERLTGHHETCSLHEFKSGVGNRGASIRIPLQVAEQGYGYLEDRRPSANADPYLVGARLIATTCGIDF